MKEIVEIIGLIGSCIVGVMFIPQIYQVHKKKDTRALNYSFLFLNMTASSSGMLYSIYFAVLPMIIANVSAFVSSFTLVYMKTQYDNRNEDNCQV